MFDKLKDLWKFGSKDNEIVINSPLKGELCSLGDVNDPVFSNKIIGDGVAIKPLSGRVVAPINGRVGVIIDTKHAISIISNQGVEILIHVGLDTVKLNGEFYQLFVNTGDTVEAGDLLLEFDLEKIKAAGYDVITPVAICNTSDFSSITAVTGRQVEELDRIMIIKK